MLQCHKETIFKLFYNVSSSFLLLLAFFHLTSLVLAKLFLFLGGNPFYSRSGEDGLALFTGFSDEEAEEENECSCFKPMEGDDGDVTRAVYGDVEEERFAGNSAPPPSSGEELSEKSEVTCYGTPDHGESNDNIKVVREEILVQDTDTDTNSDPEQVANETDHRISNRVFSDKKGGGGGGGQDRVNSWQDENFLVFHPWKAEGKSLMQEKDEEQVFGETFTVGSTSKDSSGWRSSINCRDSGTDDPFSSSSRRSCPKWESYTVFQKYDEEMLFLDRISVQKLSETESLRSIHACPRSISERIVHNIGKVTRKSSKSRHTNPYHDLEAAYVAQICLTWEALNWNYKHFQRLRASRREHDPGCPACVAQQFQQFQVLLQRYIENEPYEHGKRPEIYARMRSLAPKLLQVPEYRDSDQDEKREEGAGSRIPSNSFQHIMEESIRTFLNFMKQDRKSHCQRLASLFSRNSRRGSADATLLLLLKKVNKKKKAKLNEFRRTGKCLRKRRLKGEEELEVVMGLIDLKVVSRVLRMGGVNGEQLHWCESKMSKVRVCEGKLHRDSAPLFFPAH